MTPTFCGYLNVKTLKIWQSARILGEFDFRDAKDLREILHKLLSHFGFYKSYGN